MPGSGTLRVGRLAGIPVGIHPLWLVVVGLLTAGLGGSYYPESVPSLTGEAALALGLASTLTLFAGVLAHELGHAVVARRHGVRVEEIDLWLLGGVARILDEPRRPGDELRFALAGPAVTAAWLAVCSALLIAARAGGWADWIEAFVAYQVYVNAAILGFNLLPAFPLDGGRVLRALLWRRCGDHDAATARAARAGGAFGWSFVVVGALATFGGANGLFLVLVGGFLIIASRAEQQRATLHHLLGDLPVRDVMVRAPVTVPDGLAGRQLVDDVVRRHLFASFPVVDDGGRAVGLLTFERLRRLEPARRDACTAGELADANEELVVGPDALVVDLVSRPAFARVGRAVVVDDRQQVIGLVSRTDVERRARARQLAGAA